MTKIGDTLRGSPTRFLKRIPGLANPAEIDLSTGTYVSQQKQDLILVDEIHIDALRGIDLVFEATEAIAVDGRILDGTVNQVTARLVAPELHI